MSFRAKPQMRRSKIFRRAKGPDPDPFTPVYGIGGNSKHLPAGANNAAPRRSVPCSQESFLSRRGGHEFQRHAVHAVALTGRRGPVIEHVAKMAAAAAAMHLLPDHAESIVGFHGDGAIERGIEARPTGVAVELG